MEVSEQRIKVIWEPLVFTGGGIAISCPVTLQGSFHSKTLSKVCGQLVGYISKAAVHEEACEGDHLVVQAESLPWHVRYESFEGVLPRITSIRLQIINAGLRLEIGGGVTCLFKSTAASPLRGDVNLLALAEGLKANTLTPLATASIPLFEGGILCPRSLVFSHEAEISKLEPLTLIFVRLVQ